MECKLIKAGSEMHLYCTDKLETKSEYKPEKDSYMCIYPNNDPYKRLCVSINASPPPSMWSIIADGLWQQYEEPDTPFEPRHNSFY